MLAGYVCRVARALAVPTERSVDGEVACLGRCGRTSDGPGLPSGSAVTCRRRPARAQPCRKVFLVPPRLLENVQSGRRTTTTLTKVPLFDPLLPSVA